MRYLILLAALAVSACSGQPRAPGEARPPAVETEGACGAAKYGALLGQPSEALEKVLILAPVRIIRPGSAVTMDFIAHRLNFQIDAANRIARITCG